MEVHFCQSFACFLHLGVHVNVCQVRWIKRIDSSSVFSVYYPRLILLLNKVLCDPAS